jgi:predicted RNase H-like HicB family nuclease
MIAQKEKIPNYRIIASYSTEDACYVARVAGVPSCAAHGNTPEAAVREARIALRGFIECEMELGRELPDADPMLAELRLLRPVLNLSRLAIALGIPRTTLDSRLKNGTPFSASETEQLHQLLGGTFS